MRQPTSSPISDSAPYLPPERTEVEAKEENEFASLGSNKRYPEVIAYLKERQNHYRKYLPDGTPVVKVPDDRLAEWWKCATTIIAELDAFINIVEVSTNAVRESQRR